MFDTAIQKNLLLWDSIFQKMKDVSVHALSQGRNFLPIHYTLSYSAPYIDNMALFCNEYFGGYIDNTKAENLDLLTLADVYRKKIDDIHHVIQQQGFQQEVRTDFYSDDAMNDIGNLLLKINKLPKQQGYIQRYFMESLLIAATAVESQNRLETEAGLAQNISQSELPEKVIAVLKELGIQINEENEDSVLDLLCQTCGEALLSRKPAIPSELNKKISHILSNSFAVDENILRSNIQDQSEVLCTFIKNTKSSMRQPQAAIRNLMLFSQNLKHISHNDVENIIYISKIPSSVHISDNTLSANAPLPEYVRSFADTEAFKKVQSQMAYWDKYEKDSHNFDEKSIKFHAGILSLSWLRHLYQDLNYYEELLYKVSEQKDDEEDDNIKIRDYEGSASEKEILDFAKDLVVAAKYSDKYADFKINKTGVDENTLNKMSRKDTLDVQDVNILEEMFHIIDQNLEDGVEVLRIADIPDYESSIQDIIAMPHGVERQDALKCADGALGVVFEDMYELMECALFDVDCIIGQSKPQADEELEDFINDTIREYPDLCHESAESLTCKIHSGVVAAYLIPLYQKAKTNEKQKDAAVSFIDDYEDMQPETQKFLQGLTEYYAQKISSDHPMWQENEYTTDFKEALETYEDAQVSLRYITDLQDDVTQALDEEKALSVKYNKYQAQKAMFELPKNFDLMLASKFMGAVKQRY